MVAAHSALQVDFHCMNRDAPHAFLDNMRTHVVAPNALTVWLASMPTNLRRIRVWIVLLAMKVLHQELLHVGYAELAFMLHSAAPQHAAHVKLERFLCHMVWLPAPVACRANTVGGVLDNVWTVQLGPIRTRQRNLSARPAAGECCVKRQVWAHPAMR